MSNPAITIKNLTKIYKLFKKPHHRFLDMFGLLRQNNGRYTEHAALDNISLNINRGEKVAIIGRNGAGKSTFLKIISNVIEPTSGEVCVNGTIHALLEIGTGFHPDFTGRENIYSYLANVGVIGKDADKKVAEIIEFAEIEDYIDQPMKTYSTGMGVRLMFASSTMIRPDILVIDEVLGVGDGYFVQKSYERIETLCEGEGTTLLLVTHDLYSASRVCNRCIWIDKGKILIDADTKTAINRYESSIRDQQELRLRNIHLDALKRNLQKNKDIQATPIFGQIRCRGVVPVDDSMPIDKLKLYSKNDLLAELTPGKKEDANSTIRLLLVKGENNWGEIDCIDGRNVRCLTPNGSIYHRAPFIIQNNAVLDAMKGDSLWAELEYKDTATKPIVLELFFPDGISKCYGELDNKGDAKWKRGRVELDETTKHDTVESDSVRYGTQTFSITDVKFLNEENSDSYSFDVGGVMKVLLHYKIRAADFNEKPIIQIKFINQNNIHTHRFLLETVNFNYKKKTEGYLEVIADPILFGPGKYFVNVVVMREGGYDPGKASKFFTVNENILDHHSRAYQVEIKKTNNNLVDTCVFLHPAKWIMDGKDVFGGIYWVDDDTCV